MARVTVDGEAKCALLHRLAGQRHDLLDLLRRRLLLDGAFAHDVEAGRAVSHQAADVDHRPQPLERVEIAAVGLPVPGQASQDRMFRNVLHGLHHAGEELPILVAAGREGDPAVAEQSRGDPVPGDGRHLRIPADLGIEVGVQIDEAGNAGGASHPDHRRGRGPALQL